VRVKTRYQDRTLILPEPLDVEEGTEIEIILPAPKPQVKKPRLEDRLARFNAVAGCLEGATVPLKYLSREYIYED